MLLAASFASLMCVRAGSILWWILSLLGWSLTMFGLRVAAGRMRDQHHACQLCGWCTVVSSNIIWFSYHCVVVDAPKVLNESPFLLILALLFVLCHGCAGVLMTSWPQRIFMTLCVVVHNTYANSLVPANMKLFSDAEAGLLVAFIAMVCLALSSLVPQLARFMTRAHDAEAGERRARRQADELDQHVAALERARRQALSERVGHEKVGPRRRPAGEAATCKQQGGFLLRSVREE